jgi:hypothetical protein
MTNHHRIGHHPGQSNARSATQQEAQWQQYLPAEWRDAIDAPLYFAHYSEYEIAASRTVGYDADDQPCFTAHQVTLTRLTSDDDEEYYETVSYCEEMAAWRLRDERWLVFRMTGSGQCGSSKGFYAIHPKMPR